MTFLPDETLPLQHLGGGADDRGRRSDLVRGIRHEAPLHGERRPDRYQGSARDKERHERGAGQPDQADQAHDRDQALRLAIMERQHESGLQPASGPVHVPDRKRQEADGDRTVRDGPEVATRRARRGNRRLVGKTLARNARRIGDQAARGIENEEERVRRLRRPLVGCVATGRGKLAGQPLRLGRRGLVQGMVHVLVQRPRRDDRGRGPDGKDKRADQQERHDGQPPARGREQPSGRGAVAHALDLSE